MLREHLRACANCRGTLRAYRAAPGAAAALAPALPLSRSLFDRAHDAVAGLAARLGGGGGDSALPQVAASGGTRGAGVATLAKVVAICVGSAGGAAACVAGGIVPAPAELGRDRAEAPTLERRIDPVIASGWAGESGVDYEPAPQPEPQPPSAPPVHPKETAAVVQPVAVAAPESTSGATEYAPQPQPVATPEPGAAGDSSAAAGGNPAGEFGP